MGPTWIGVSLKMYFGHRRTRDWCAAVREVALASPAVGAGVVELVVLPTHLSVPQALEVLAGSGASVGAQDLASADEGAWTGEVSGAELAEVGCRYAEVGHAERRTLLGEDDAVVAAKTAAALRHGLSPVLCVGEQERGDPAEAAGVVVAEALGALPGGRLLDGAPGLVVAYEPHWAIGQAEPAPTEHVVAVCEAVRARLDEHGVRHRLVYGGSAGPGLLTDLGSAVDGLFLGRFAHDPGALADVLAEAAAAPGRGQAIS